METISVLLAICEGNPPVSDGFPSKRPVKQSFKVFFENSSAQVIFYFLELCFISASCILYPQGKFQLYKLNLIPWVIFPKVKFPL